MNTFLLFLDKTVPAQSMRFGLLDLVSRHKPVELVLLQSPEPLPGESVEAARQAARDSIMSAQSLLSAMGLPVVDAIVGDALPKKAIAAEIRGGKHRYDAILLSTPAKGVLRFLHFDLAHQLERKFGVPVSYIQQSSSYGAGVA